MMRGDDLRAGLEALVDEWEHPAEVYALRMSAAPRLRALLDAHPTPSEPEATVVEEWGVRDPSGDDGPFDEDVARRLVADGWQAGLIHRTATYRVGLVLDRVTEWTEADR